MAIGTPNVGTYTDRTSEATTAVPFPATVNAGDVLVMFGSLATNGNSAAITNPAGWTQDQQFCTSGSVGPDLFVAWMVAAGTEGGTTVSVTHVSAGTTWQIIGFSGVDTTTPLDAATQIVQDTAAATSMILPSITTVSTGVTLIGASSLNSGTGGPPTPPAGFTQFSGTITGNGRASGFAYRQGVGAGATGTQTYSWGATSAKGVGVLMALRPAATPTTVPITKGGITRPVLRASTY